MLDFYPGRANRPDIVSAREPGGMLRVNMSKQLDLAAFRSTGVQKIGAFFEPELRERFAALGRDIADATRAGKINRNAQFAQVAAVNDDSLIATSARLHQAAQTVLGDQVCWTSIRVLMKDRTFRSSIEVHQDWPYFGGDTRKLNVFIPLTRCRRENGMLVFYEGSHSVGPVERGAIDIDRYPEFTPVCPTLEVGDVLFADFLTWHSSVEAIEDEDRIMLQVVLQPASDRSANNLFGRGWQPLGRETPYRTTPMLNAVPSIGIETVRHMLANAKLDEAERMARGLVIDSGNNVEAHLLLRDIAIARGESGEEALEAAVVALRSLRDRLNNLRADETRSETDDSHKADPHKSEIRRLQRELEDMRSTTSWKITAPIRRLVSAFRT